MAATAVTLNDLEGHSLVAGLFNCNPSNTCVAFYTISTDSVLAQFLCISRASCNYKASSGDHNAPTHQISSKLGNVWLSYCNSTNFQDGGRPHTGL